MVKSRENNFVSLYYGRIELAKWSLYHRLICNICTCGVGPRGFVERRGGSWSVPTVPWTMYLAVGQRYQPNKPGHCPNYVHPLSISRPHGVWAYRPEESRSWNFELDARTHRDLRALLIYSTSPRSDKRLFHFPIFFSLFSFYLSVRFSIKDYYRSFIRYSFNTDFSSERKLFTRVPSMIH